MTAPLTIRERFISLVIPNRNGAGVIERCLRAAFAANYGNYEVVVVDDGSEDESVEIIRRFPCRLVELETRQGVSKARNAGVRASRGELLFFIDNDCILGPDALSIANASLGERKDRVLGGTYTPAPFDSDFFSTFQSVFIHHSETRKLVPDYVAAHAMVMDAGLFRRSGGFIEDSFIGVDATVEDIELSHRLRRAGAELVMNGDLQVTHVFRFSLQRSVRNAIKKARSWTEYSLVNGDLFHDSGSASLELKANVVSCYLTALLLALGLYAPIVPLLALNLFLNRKLVAAWARTRRAPFAVMAAGYYMTLYAAAAGIGAASGALQYFTRRWTQ